MATNDDGASAGSSTGRIDLRRRDVAVLRFVFTEEPRRRPESAILGGFPHESRIDPAAETFGTPFGVRVAPSGERIRLDGRRQSLSTRHIDVLLNAHNSVHGARAASAISAAAELAIADISWFELA